MCRPLGDVWTAACLPSGSRNRTATRSACYGPSTVPSEEPASAPVLTGQRRGVNSVTFAPDGRTLATGSFDGTVILWDVADPAPYRVGQRLIHN